MVYTISTSSIFSDSGHSTLRDIPDIDSEYEPESVEEEMPGTAAARRRHRTSRRRMLQSRHQNDSGTTGTDSEVKVLKGTENQLFLYI